MLLLDWLSLIRWLLPWLLSGWLVIKLLDLFVVWCFVDFRLLFGGLLL